MRLIKAMLRKDSPTREPALNWICAAIEVNTTRGKEYMNHSNDSSDNFMLNIAYTMLRLAEPLTQDESKVASINPLYALSGKRYLAPPNREGKVNLCTYDDETKFALESDALDSWVDKRNLARIQAFDALRMARDAQEEVARAEEDGMEVEQLDKDELAMAIQMSLETDGDEQNAKAKAGFNFATEAFFMTARALHHGLIPTLKVSVNSNMQHGSSTYTVIRQELSRLNQAAHAAQQAQGQGSPEFETAMASFGQLMACKNLFDAALLDPELLGLAMSFYGLMARWLTRMATGHEAAAVATVALPLPKPPPMELAALPEHFAEDLCEFLLLVQEYKPEVFEQTAEGEIQCILSLMTVLLASPGYVRNPYLRCKFVAVIHSLLPESEEMQLQRQRSRSVGASADMSGLLVSNPLCQSHLVVSLLQVYVDIENTGSHNQFHEKFKPREQVYGLLAHLCDTTAEGAAAGAAVTDGYPASLIECLGSANYRGESTAAKFISLLLNDTIFLFEDAMLKLKKIKELEVEEESWESLPEEEREAKKKEIEQERGHCRYHLKQVDKTLHFLGYVTAHSGGVAPFVAPEMVDRMAGMVNAFVSQLVGSKASELKVAKKEAVPEWQPREMLHSVLRLCAHLHANAPDAAAAEKYVTAVVTDGRYSADVYRKAVSMLGKIAGEGDPLLAPLRAFVETHGAATAAEIDLDAEDVPDEYLDPIMATLMTDPVTLPCGNVMERSVIQRMLLDTGLNPFSRAALTAEELVPHDELREKIAAWKASR